LLHALPAALPEAHVIAWVRDDESRLDDVDELELRRVRVRGGGAGRIAFETFGLARDVRRTGADILLSPNESLPAVPPCPVVVVAQNLVYHRDDEGTFTGGAVAQRFVSRAQFAYYRRRMRASYRQAVAVIAVSSETRRVLGARAGLDEAKTTVVFEGSDSVLMPAPRGGLAREPRLLVVGALSPYKGLVRTLDAHAELRARGHDLVLELVGSDWRGYRRVLERRVAELGTTASVAFRSAVSARELAALYETSLVLLTLSECESFGLPVVEAMRYGLPVVAAASSSLPEIAGDAALLLDGGEDAAVGIERLLQDDRARAALVERGRARAAELTWRASAEGVAGVLRECVSRGAG
jgi:glycosyltransferase involved in cell wall biosynthesis